MHKPTDSVRIVIFNNQKSDSFLVLTEIDDPHNFKLPGGRFEGDLETPEQASIRELAEELGLLPEHIALIKAGELVNDDGFSKRYIFHARVDPQALNPSAEIAQILWVNLDTIPTSKNSTHIRAAVELCL
jgi:ADP-ribose pyrophosphatase YjhB (NUDIX family)